MKIILTQNTPNLGSTGDVKEVSTGYAHNYLIKKGLAKIATKETINILQKKKEKEDTDSAKNIDNIKKLANKIKTVKLKLISKANDQGKLFAGIDAKSICDELKKQNNLIVNKETLEFKSPIKQVGEHEITFKLKKIESKFKIEIKTK